MTASTEREPSSLIFLDSILASLAKASDYNRNDMTAPAVVLWTDKDWQWEPLADRLRESLPHFLTLGDYGARKVTGKGRATRAAAEDVIGPSSKSAPRRISANVETCLSGEKWYNFECISP